MAAKTITFLKLWIQSTSFKHAIYNGIFALLLYIFTRLSEAFITNDYISIGLQLALWLVIISLVVSIIRSLMVTAYRTRYEFSADYYDNYTAAIIYLLDIVKVFWFFGIVLSVFGLNILNFLTSISIVAVALVLIFKEPITNTLNGVILIFSQSMRIGDYVVLGEHKGIILDINLQYIKLRNERGEIVYIPNATIFTKDVCNISQSKEKFVAHTITLPVVAQTQFSEFASELKTTLRTNLDSQNLGVKTIDVSISAIAKDSISVLISVGISSYKLSKERKIVTEIMRGVLSTSIIRQQATKESKK